MGLSDSSTLRDRNAFWHNGSRMSRAQEASAPSALLGRDLD